MRFTLLLRCGLCAPYRGDVLYREKSCRAREWYIVDDVFDVSNFNLFI